MDPLSPPQAIDAAGHCACDYPFCARSPPVWRQSATQGLAEDSEDVATDAALAKREIAALREVVAVQERTIEELSADLEAEQDAAAAAANAAMSTILRLQHEKAEIQMEARQYKRFMEEKMAYDEQELDALECFVHCLSSEAQSYKNRLARHGIDPGPEDGDIDIGGEGQCECEDDLPAFDYPQIRCALTADDDNDDGGAFGETPHGERVIYRMRTMEKGITGHCRACSRSFSNPSGFDSFSVTDLHREKGEEINPVTAACSPNGSNDGDDEERVVHEVPMVETSETSEYYVQMPQDECCYHVETPTDDYYVETPLTDDERIGEADGKGGEERTGDEEAAGLKQLCVLTTSLGVKEVLM